MLQDSQTFSDITAIDTKDQLTAQVDAVVHGTIVYDLLLNGKLIAPGSHTIDLLEPVSLQVNVHSCEPGHNAVDISLSIQGKQILPVWGHLTSSGSCYINQPGIWKFATPASFYPWYFEKSGAGLIF